MSDSPWKNFSYRELACKCGSCGIESGRNISVKLMDNIQILRERCGFPLSISSAYRCAQHPDEAKKSTPGTHNQGVAVDILCNGKQAHTILREAIRMNVFTGIGINQKGNRHRRFIHLDISDGNTRPWIWSY